MLLKIMNNKWTELGIEDWFIDVHHLRLKQVSSTSSTLIAFVNYCGNKRLKGQNAQTIERALEVAKYVKKGIKPSAAIRIAWESYPLVKS